MIQFSQQHRIVNNISLSFKNNTKSHAKISEKTLSRDIIFLKPSKYETYTESNFKFITLWTVFKNNTGKIDTLKLMNAYNSDDIKYLMKEKEKILLYKNTFQADSDLMKAKVQSPAIVLKLYNKGNISALYTYWYFQQNEPLGRIQTKQVERVNLFMSFFPGIQEYLDTLIKV